MDASISFCRAMRAAYHAAWSFFAASGYVVSTSRGISQSSQVVFRIELSCSRNGSSFSCHFSQITSISALLAMDLSSNMGNPGWAARKRDCSSLSDDKPGCAHKGAHSKPQGVLFSMPSAMAVSVEKMSSSRRHKEENWRYCAHAHSAQWHQMELKRLRYRQWHARNGAGCRQFLARNHTSYAALYL